MKYLITSIVFLVTVHLSLAQSTWSHSYSKLTINDVAEVQNNLWVATDIGLFKVNKTTLQTTHYTTGNSVLPHNHVQTLVTDQFNNLWIGTYELFLIQIDPIGGSWMVITQPDSIAGVSLAGNRIYSSVVDNNGTILLSSELGLLSYNGTTWGLTQYKQGFGAPYPMWDLCINSMNDVHVGSFNLLSINNNSNTFTENLSPLNSNGILAYSDASILQKDDNTIFYFTDHNGINRVQNGNWTTWDFNNNSLPISPRGDKVSPCINANGLIYYNTYSNLLGYFDGNQWLVDSSFALTNPAISSIEYFFISDNGDFWFFQDNVFVKYNATSSIAGQLTPLVGFNFQSEVVMNQSGTTFLAGFNKGIQEYNQGNWNTITGSNNFANFETEFNSQNKAWFISRDNNYNPTIVEQTNNGWFMHDSTSTNGLFHTSANSTSTVYFNDIAINSNDVVFVQDYLDRILKYENNLWSLVYSPNNPSNTYTSSMTADVQGNIWWLERVTITFGVYSMSLKKYDGATVVSYPATGNSFQKPYIDANNHIWVSLTQGQLNEFDGVNWTTHTLPINQYIQTITGFNNYIYVGTSANGLFEFDGITWTNYSTSNSLLSNNDIRDLDIDAMGNLWISNAVGQVIDIYNNGIINSTTQIKEQPQAINLYPNPTQNQLQLSTTIIDIQSIKVVDALGQIVLETSSNTRSIDVSELNSGLYWVVINTTTEQFNEPFVKL